MVARMGRRAVLLAYALIVIVPLLVMLLGTFKTQAQLFSNTFGLPQSLSPTNYSQALHGGNMATAFVNSVLVCVPAVLCTLGLTSLVAFAIVRLPGWRGRVMYGFLVIGIAIPVQSAIIPQYVLFFRLGLLNSRFGLALAYIVVTIPIAVFILTGFMRTLPSDLFDAAMVDGSGAWRTYRSVVLPLSRPSLAATGIFLFVIDWNDLIYALFMVQDPSKQTLPLALLSFTGEFRIEYPLLFAGVAIASAPVVIAYVFMQRYFVSGLTAGSMKG